MKKCSFLSYLRSKSKTSEKQFFNTAEFLRGNRLVSESSLSLPFLSHIPGTEIT